MMTTRKITALLTTQLRHRVFWTALMVVPMAFSAQAATQAPITGEIMMISVDNPNDVYSRGTITVGGQNVIIPANMVIDLPANRLTLQQFFTQAPPECIATGETGLAKADACNTSMTGAIATILANRTNAGNVIAGEVTIEKATESVLGTVSYIDYTDGYLRVNGNPGDATTGTMIRINDPEGRFTVQQGLGVAAGNTSNGSADPRYGVDPDNYTATFSTGYPACIPSTVTGVGNRTVGSDANGIGDPFCPDTNRTPSNVPADAFRFAPIQLGDHIAAEGNFEIIDGVQFLSAHTLVVHHAILTVNGQPDYLIFDEVEWDVAGFNNERVRTLFIGFSSRGDTLVDIFALHIDPDTGQETEHVIASTIGCDAVGGAQSCTAQGIGATAPGIFKIRYDLDFLVPQDKPELLPCPVLANSNLAQIGHTNPCGSATTGTAANFAVLSPISRDLIGRSRNKVVGNGGSPFPDGIDIRGNAAPNGEYLNPVGIGHPEFVEVNLAAIQTPFIFAGQPWNLDRRLGPGGSEGANPGTPQPLDPFPYSGLDPRAQTGTPLPTLIGNTANRIFAFVTNPGANDGVLGGALAWPPADPPAEAITAAPIVEVTCPLFPDTFVENLHVNRAEYRAGNLPGQPLVIIATTSAGAGMTLTANWGTGSGDLTFVDVLANGKARYRGVFRRLATPPGTDVTITSSLGTIATSPITTVP